MAVILISVETATTSTVILISVENGTGCDSISVETDGVTTTKILISVENRPRHRGCDSHQC